MDVVVKMTIQSKLSWVETRGEKTEGWKDRSLLCRSGMETKSWWGRCCDHGLTFWFGTKLLLGFWNWSFMPEDSLTPLKLHKIIITFQMIPFIVKQNHFYNFSNDPFHHCEITLGDLPSPCKCCGQTPCNNTYHYHYCCCCCCCWSIHPNLSIHPSII